VIKRFLECPTPVADLRSSAAYVGDCGGQYLAPGRLSRGGACRKIGGVSRQRTYQITNRADFPEPVAVLGQGKVWLAEDVERWMREHRTALDD
jgi:prophage regulatory protein